MNKTHELVDSRTGAVVGTHTSARAAYRAADRKDSEYGAVRYIVRRVTNLDSALAKRNG